MTLVATTLFALAVTTGLGTAASASSAPGPLLGYDVSWPQCSTAQGGYDLPLPPTGADFVVIGLTKGLAFTENPCLAQQVAHAEVNGIPAHAYAMATFPTPTQLADHGSAGPFDASAREGRLRNTGYAQAAFALTSLASIGWSPPTVWVDVEPRPAQPWPTGTAAARQENRWVIEGLLRGLRDSGLGHGLYSYSSGWQEITGGWSLPGVPVWATAGRLDYPEEARDRCMQPGFSGGEVHIAQWTDGVRDYNLTCGVYRFSSAALRVFGSDRYATSVSASQQAFPDGADVAFVASGADFADALAGGAASARGNGPVLLVGPGSVPDVVAAELRRLSPDMVHILGGPTAVTPAVASELAARWDINRVSGADRYGTAAAVAGLFWNKSTTVFLAVGSKFPDALAGGAAAVRMGAPILLTRSDGLPPQTASRLGALAPRRVILLGDSSAISEPVVAEVRVAAPDAIVERVAGPDRYTTASSVVQRFWPQGSEAVIVAKGSDFPDALSAVPLAAVHEAPVVLSRSTCTPSATTAVLEHTGADLRLLMGGKNALATFVLDIPCPG